MMAHGGWWLLQGVLEAKRMRKRIEQLQQYRRMGIRNQVPS